MRGRALLGFGVLVAAIGIGLVLERSKTGEDAAAVCNSSSTTADRDGDEARFLAENDKAMASMMAGMTVKPSGDIDRDFAAMMIPHHQGAIDMAQSELRHGKNEQLRRIAQEIIVDQLQEIDAMRLAVGQDPLPPAAAPTQVHPTSPVLDHDRHDMSGGMMMAPGTHMN